MSCGDLTITVGKAFCWRWVAPDPVVEGETPTLTVAGPDGAIAGVPALARVAASGSIADDGLSADRRVLTLTAAIVGDRARVAGEGWGAAFLITPASGVFPVRVSGIGSAGDTVTLADALPRSVTVDGGSIQWATWWTTFSAADVTAEVRRDLTTSVQWAPLLAGTADGEDVTETDGGRVSVVVRPFATGLTDRFLRESYPSLAPMTPGRDNSREAIIDAALDELALMIGPHTMPLGLALDQLDGRPFRPAHAALAAAMAVDAVDPDNADRWRARAAGMIPAAFACAWKDGNGNGAVDPGEDSGRRTMSLAATRMSSLFPSTHPLPTTPRWYRGKAH